MNIKKEIILLLQKHPNKQWSRAELREILGVTPAERKNLTTTLKVLEKETILRITKKKQVYLNNAVPLLIGKFYGNSAGYGFVVGENREHSLFIPNHCIHEAMHEDLVVAKLTSKAKIESRKSEGEILSVVARRTEKIIGTYMEHENGFGFIIPDNERYTNDIYIPVEKSNHAKSYDKVKCIITRYPRKNRKAEGEIVEILGVKGEEGVDLLSVLMDRGLPYEFSNKVKVEATGQAYSETEEKRRLDLRKRLIFTIDGEDAKDLDDAISVETLRKGVVRLGVHIADVSHYVKEGTELDKEAYQRGTSAYFVDQVVPMLPNGLSNELCSLHPNTDKLALSVFLDIDDFGNILKTKIVESIICSKARLNYTEVSDFLEGKIDSLESIASGLDNAVNITSEIAKWLKNRRDIRGSIDFSFPESLVQLSDDGEVEHIYIKEKRIGHSLIEECMLACNEAVAKEVMGADLPFLYRIHEEPRADFLENFYSFIEKKGFTLEEKEVIKPKDLQILLRAAGPNQNQGIQFMLLRALMQAKYTAVNKGHFGLAAAHYTHFTSPIRRYPDLMNHRIVKAYVRGGLHPGKKNEWEKQMAEIARHSSRRERIAEQAENDYLQLKKMEWAEKSQGEVYEGVITNINHTSIEVSLPNTVSGKIAVASFLEDSVLHESISELEGVCSNEKISLTLGDPLTVQIKGVRSNAREIEFEIIR